MIKRSLKKSASLFETVLKPFEIACPEVYFRVPLYRCTSMYIGRGQVLFQNLFLTYSPPILGRSADEICA